MAVATALAPGVASCRAVVQLDGAMSTVSYQTGAEIILGRCAMCYAQRHIRLPAPLYADPSTVASMRGDSVMSRTLRAGRHADADALRRRCRFDVHDVVRGQLPGHQHARRADGMGAVGEIGGRFFDAAGRTGGHRTGSSG